MKKIAFFLSYAYSIQEGVNNGTIGRLEKELQFLSKIFFVDVYSKDSNKFLKQFIGKSTFENIKFYGIPFSFISIQNSNRVNNTIRRIFSILMFIQYYFLSFTVKNKLDKADACFVYHVSGGMRAVLYKKFFKTRMKVIVRYNWNWGDFIKASRNSLEYRFFCFLEKFILSNSDIIMATTELLQKQAEDIVNGKKQVIIIPNWIDCNEFKPLDSQKEFDIISIGRLCPQKNHMLLLKAVNLYNKEKNSHLKILIISKGELRDTLIGYAQQYNIELTIIDKVPNTLISEYLNRAGIFVMSSRYEGHPKVLLEAMACALPVIGTDVVGIRDVICDYENGILSREEAVNLKNKIDSIRDNPTLAKKLGLNARRYIEENCDFERIMDKVKNQLIFKNEII